MWKRIMNSPKMTEYSNIYRNGIRLTKKEVERVKEEHINREGNPPLFKLLEKLNKKHQKKNDHE